MLNVVRRIGWILIFFVLVLSRVWVLQHPPKPYSDVTKDYERYANQWRYGLTPYREIMFEYPPAAIPLLALPLELDQRGIGTYYQNYRIQIFVFEFFFIAFLLIHFFKSRYPILQTGLALLFYLVAGIWAKDFWYEGLDLVFFGLFSVLLLGIRWQNQGGPIWRVVTWSLFWLTVSIKIMTLPLLLPLFLLRKTDWKKDILLLMIGFILIWGAPLLIFRSALSVFVVFHADRPLKYGSFGNYLIERANDIWHSEIRIPKGPDFPMSGPVSQKVAAAIKVIFPTALVLWSLWVWQRSRKERKYVEDAEQTFIFLLRMTLAWVFILFITGKTFSSPFHIWYVPLLTMYPFRSRRVQFAVYFFALLMLGLDTTPYLEAPIELRWLRDGMRFFPMFFFIAYFSRDIRNNSVITIVQAKNAHE